MKGVEYKCVAFGVKIRVTAVAGLLNVSLCQFKISKERTSSC